MEKALVQTIYDLIERKLGVRVYERVNPVTSSVGTSVTEILRENASRIAIVLINLGAYPLFVAFDREVSATRGVRVAANGGFFTMFWEEDFTLPARALYGIAPDGAVNIYVVELIIYKGG